jgi:capsular polysaccharide biosynthesis protein
MKSGGNVLGAVMWGMRKYLWLVVLFVIAFGVLLPTWQGQGKAVYESRAQVGPTQPLNLPNLDPLPRMGDTVFHNGAVETSVRRLLGVDSSVSVIPKHCELVAPQDNIVFTVICRADTPEAAAEMADLAASTFTLELNKYSSSVGEFTIQSAADLPVDPVPNLRGGPVSLALGAFGGLVLGTGVVVLLVILRRPVVDADGAEDASAVPVLGKLRVPRSGEPIEDITELAHICRSIIPHDPQVVWLAAPRGSTRAAQQMANGLARVWERVERACVDKPTPGHPDFVVLEKAGDELLDNERPSMTLLVVPVGMRSSRLRTMARSYFTGAPMSVVMYSLKGVLPPYLTERPEPTASLSTGPMAPLDPFPTRPVPTEPRPMGGTSGPAGPPESLQLPRAVKSSKAAKQVAERSALSTRR